VNDPNVIRPIGARMYVERIRPKQTPGGLHIPECFKAGKNGLSARERMNGIPDYFLVRILAIGSEECSGFRPGDHTFVWSYREGDGSRLYTGDSVGERDRIVIRGRRAGDSTEPDHLDVLVEP